MKHSVKTPRYASSDLPKNIYLRQQATNPNHSVENEPNRWKQARTRVQDEFFKRKYSICQAFEKINSENSIPDGILLLKVSIKNHKRIIYSNAFIITRIHKTFTLIIPTVATVLFFQIFSSFLLFDIGWMKKANAWDTACLKLYFMLANQRPRFHLPNGQSQTRTRIG